MPKGHEGVRFRTDEERDRERYRECLALPECVSQGRTREEARRNIAEAIELYVESLCERNEPIPPPIAEDTVDVRAMIREAELTVEEFGALFVNPSALQARERASG